MAKVLAVYAFIASEIVFFGTLISAFILYRYADASGPSPDDLNVGRTALFSIALWARSGTLLVSGRQLRAGNHRASRLWLVSTIVLGIIFAYGQITEYMAMYRDNITIKSNLFTSAFFTLTGFHGFHVIIGVIALSVLAFFAFTGQFRDREPSGVEAVSVYWHFVDAVWVVIFTLVYVLPLLGL